MSLICLLQAERLVNPTNPKAIGAAGASGSGRVGGDTEIGVRKWMGRLADKLKGTNPMPVVIQPESQDASAPPTRIELLINDYAPAMAAAVAAL